MRKSEKQRKMKTGGKINGMGRSKMKNVGIGDG